MTDEAYPVGSKLYFNGWRYVTMPGSGYVAQTWRNLPVVVVARDDEAVNLMLYSCATIDGARFDAFHKELSTQKVGDDDV